MKLSRQITALIAIPLVCEIAFVVVLVNALNKAEEDFIREARNNEIVNCVNMIVKDILSGGSLVGMRYLTRNDDYLNGIEKLVEDIGRQRSQLRSLVKEGDERYAEYQEFDSYLASNIVSFQSIRKMMLDPENKMEGILFLRKINKLFALTETAGSTLVQNKLQSSRDARLAQVQSRKNVSNVIICGVIFNLLLAGALAFLMITQTLKRLNVLMINNQRLAYGQPLAAPLGGGDEIGTIDATFHSMAETLHEAKQREHAFVSMLSHDLRSPITGVKLMLELVEDGVYGELNERGREMVSVSEKAIGRSLQMISDFLEIERMEAGELKLTLKPHDLFDTISDAVVLVSPQAEEKSIAIDLIERHAEFVYDDARVFRVLTNFLSNAIKFSASGTTVSVSLDEKESDVKVTVSDEGPGIPEDKLAAVFDRYKQVDRGETTQTQGFGLGLPVCKAIVEAHGGAIGVESRVGSGSAFWFTLPR